MKREKLEVIRMVMEMNVEVSRGRGRLKKRWLDAFKNDTRAVGVCVDGARDCVEWRFRTRVTNPKYLGYERERRKKKTYTQYDVYVELMIKW